MTTTSSGRFNFSAFGIELPEMLGQGQMDGGVVPVDRHEAVEAAIQASAYGIPGQGNGGGQIGPGIVLMMNDLRDGGAGPLVRPSKMTSFTGPWLDFLWRGMRRSILFR